MDIQDDISIISQINNNIYLSGIFVLDDPNSIKKLQIKYILSCVDREHALIHDKLMLENPDIVILYLPYNDNLKQNLWKSNKDHIKLLKYSNSIHSHNISLQILENYKDKPLIEIGYHFINTAIENNANILVHCIAGVSRSASLIIYFYMKKFNMTYNEAFNMVKKSRNIINPNESFKSQLLNYQIKRDKFTENDAKKIIDKY